MKKNRMDSITDGVKQRMNSIYEEYHKQYGNSRPYRQEPISKKEMMLQYDDMMQREPQLRQQFGNEVIDNYKATMAKYVGGK